METVCIPRERYEYIEVKDREEREKLFESL